MASLIQANSDSPIPPAPPASPASPASPSSAPPLI